MTLPLEGVEYVVLGCDGIFERNSNEEIIKMVKQKNEKNSLKEVGEDILDSIIAPRA